MHKRPTEIVALRARRDDAHVEHFRSRFVFVRLWDDELAKKKNSKVSAHVYLLCQVIPVELKGGLYPVPDEPLSSIIQASLSIYSVKLYR